VEEGVSKKGMSIVESGAYLDQHTGAQIKNILNLRG